MRILDRYIAKQLFTSTLFAVAVLCGVFLMGMIFKQAKPLFVGAHPSPWLVVEFIGSVLPFSLMFTIPWSFLAALLLVFGRLSSDNELVGMRMAGQSLYRIAAPVFLIAGLFCAFCFWLNVSVAPQAKDRQKQLLFEAVQEDPNRFLDPGVIKTNLKDQIVYVEAREGDQLTGLHVVQLKKDKGDYPQGYIYAEGAKLSVDRENGQLRLQNNDLFIDTEPTEKEEHTMVFIGESPLAFDYEQKKRRSLKASTMTNDRIREVLATRDDLEPKKRAELKHEITRRYSFSLACLAFACVGVPLGMTSRRKETSSGFAISIGIGLCYFLFHIAADQVKGKEGDLATILFWTPNILALIIGGWLFRRARSK